jgi:hypothetical protein
MLSALIKKGRLRELATATRATIATNSMRIIEHVASVAPVTVAYSIIQQHFDREGFEERAAIIEANGVPREWAEGYAILCTMPCPISYSPQQWEQLVNDGGLFLDKWGHESATLGWKATDVFGVDPDAPNHRYDGMGLVPLLHGRPVIAITSNIARIDCGKGNYLTFYRKMMATGTTAIWNLEEA